MVEQGKMRDKSWGETNQSIIDVILEKLRINKISKYITNNSTILDLGCGYKANFLFSVKNKIKSGIGIDVSVGKSNENIRLIQTNVDRSIPLTKGDIDTITALAIIEHVNNPDKMLKECYRLLKQRGILLITTPSRYAKFLLELLAYKLKIINASEIRDHKRYYDKHSLLSALLRAGFKQNNIEISYFGGIFNIFAIAKK